LALPGAAWTPAAMKRAMLAVPAAAAATVAAIAARDLLQREHSLLRNFPVIGHARRLIEAVGPELRQYIVAGNNEERPFTRDQRRWVYASAKKQNNYFGFGTDNDLEYTAGYPIIKHRTFGRVVPPSSPAAGHEVQLPCAKTVGAARGRAGAFRPNSVVSISAMSFGALSGNAVEALNRGAALADCLHNTGEGGISPYHRMGGELIFQIGTAYFGCRDERGRFSMERLRSWWPPRPSAHWRSSSARGPSRVSAACFPRPRCRRRSRRPAGFLRGRDCISPSRHAEFSDTDSMLDWVELLAAETGLPVGIKSAVGDLAFWDELITLMQSTGRGIDFVTIDGGEGGTGAAPLIFTDTVSLPFQLGFSRVYRMFAERGLHEQVVFVGGGKLGLPDNAIVAFALGCDMINVAREAMLAIGCSQAQKCHTDTCPTGVATQNSWLARGLDPELQSIRVANYIKTLRRDLMKVAEACGVEHPGLIDSGSVEVLDGRTAATPLHDVYGYQPGWGLPSEADRKEIIRLMTAAEPQGATAPPSPSAVG